MDRHSHRWSLVCYLKRKNVALMSKQDRIVVVGFVDEVLTCVGESVSGDVDGVNSKHMLQWGFCVVPRKVVCEGGREYFFFMAAAPLPV